jgi:hypothetical protein
LRRRGAAEAGAIYIKIDRLDGRATLYAPALPQMDAGDSMQRRFEAVMVDTDALTIEERMAREMRFDPDLWMVEVEDRNGRNFLDVDAL